MKNIPILFNTEMVQAILAGKKTQTRRIIKLAPGFSGRQVGESGNPDNPLGFMYPCGIKRPPCNKGDILWVRETFDDVALGNPWYYKADGDLRPECWKGEKWRPSIHMPREAARIFLRVTDVRAERLATISDEDAIAEGANCKGGKNIGVEEKMRRSAVERFVEIWNSTIKRKDYDKLSFAASPWVWVITFERCDKPEGW